jgi:hypothetical protein
MDLGLAQSLQEAGKPVEILRLPDESALLVLPYGGRILGLFAGNDVRNFFWVNPELKDPDSARQFFSSNRWQNTGGERTWLAPEAEYFFPHYPDLGTYLQPRPLDAGQFAVKREQGGLRLATEFSTPAWRSGGSAHVRLTLALTAAANPLRDDRRFAGLAFAGYTVQRQLERLSPGPAVGIWCLNQLPHGGEMLLPAIGHPAPRIFFGQIPAGDLSVEAGMVHYRMRSLGEHKIGLRAPAAIGRVGYCSQQGEQAELVVRNFSVQPDGVYLDGPPADPTDIGFAVEACNVANPELGHFSELEYHAPTMRAEQSVSDDRSEVWAFRGAPALVAEARRELVMKAA